MENLEQRINDLGKILNSHEMVEAGFHTESFGMASGDGHSFDDSEDIRDVKDYEKVYNFSRKERDEALYQLKRLRKTCKDKGIRKLIDSQLYEIRKEKIKWGFGCLVSLILASGIVFGMYSCIQKQNEEARKRLERQVPSSMYLKIEAEFLDKDLESIKRLKEDRKYIPSFDKYRKKSSENAILFYEKEIKKYKKDIDDYREKIKMKIEKGYLTPENHYYGDYQKIFGKEPWWPKDKTGPSMGKR